MIRNDVARWLARAIAPKPAAEAPEVSGGTVTRVDVDGTVWVQLFGSDDETPCATKTAAARPGDVVTVTIDGGRATVDGNVSAPATDDTMAEQAHELAERAIEDARASTAQAERRIAAVGSVADEAAAVANATNQHFFADEGGIHVTEAEGDATTEHNILINSLGILLRHATNNLVSLTQSAIAFYDGLGNAAGNVVASFGASGAQIGKEASYHLVLAAQRIAMMLGTDTLVGIDTNGITTTMKFAGSTQASGTGYMDAEVEAIVALLNGTGITVSNDRIYHDGEDTGYTVVLWNATPPVYYVKDAGGNNIQSAKYSDVDYYPNNTTKFEAAEDWLTPQTEVPGAPVVMEAGGVSLTFANKALKVSPPLPIASGGTGTTEFGTLVQNDMSTAYSVATATNKSIGSIQLTKGTWLIRYGVRFDTNGTGRREAVLGTSADTINAAWQRYCGSQVPAVSGGATMLNGCMLRKVTSSTETIYLTVYQSSGSSLDVTGNLQAIRIC